MVTSCALPGRTLRCQGAVTARDEGTPTPTLSCEVRVIDEAGTAIAVGTARVALLPQHS
jgi:hypothetical protein